MSNNKNERWSEKPIKVLITHDVRIKQERLVARCAGEVYWFGFVDQIVVGDETYLRVYDILLPKQEVSGSHVNFEGNTNEVLEELIAEGREDDAAKMLWFAHSHAGMSSYHSNVDVDMICEWGEVMGLPFLISHVQNKKGETDTRIDYFTESPVKMAFTRDVSLVHLVPNDIERWVREQIELKVTERKRQQTGFQGPFGQGPHASKISHADLAKYEGKEKFIRLHEGKKQIVVDGYIREEVHLTTGEYGRYAAPTEEERAADEAKAKTAPKGQAPESRGELLQIPTASDPRRRHGSDSSEPSPDIDGEVIAEEVEDDDWGPNQAGWWNNLDDDDDILIPGHRGDREWEDMTPWERMATGMFGSPYT